MSEGIYLVDVPVHSLYSRYIVIAASATEAAVRVERLRGDHSDQLSNVGRIGTYDPGMEGARMVMRGDGRFLAIILDPSDTARTIYREGVGGTDTWAAASTDERG